MKLIFNLRNEINWRLQIWEEVKRDKVKKKKPSLVLGEIKEKRKKNCVGREVFERAGDSNKVIIHYKITLLRMLRVVSYYDLFYLR